VKCCACGGGCEQQDGSEDDDVPTAVSHMVTYARNHPPGEVNLREGPNVLRRDRAAVIWIDVYSVSRHHARITVAGDDVKVEDLGSKNGTFVMERP
jgi:pSer/pThr/pTyr-binding forkhead associated (FHA) protein